MKPAPAALGAPKPPDADAGAMRWAGWALRFGPAFALLNLLLSFENRWPGFGVIAMPRLSFELCLAVLALMGWVAWRGVPGPRATTALALAFTAWVLLRYVDVTVPAVLGRPVNLYWDGRHGLELLRVTLASLPGTQLAALALGGLAGLGLLVLVVRLALAVLARSLVWPRPRPWLLAAGAALTTSFMAYVPDQRDTRWFFTLPLAPTLQQQALLLARVAWPAHGDAVLGPGPAFEGNLRGLHTPQGPADVLLLFAESYGASSFDHPEVASALAAARAALAQAAADAGLGVVSARLRSPTFGGASWLAHASVLSGLPMEDPGRHALLLASQRPTLVSHFARHGYRTVGWMPGLKRPWPEGAFYGFQRLADDAGIGYRGPDFGYWRIPDQAAMALLQQQELAPNTAHAPDPLHPPETPRAPRFVVFATVSTHAPFHPLPPLVAPWARLQGPGAYSAEDAARAAAEPLAVQQPLPNHVAALRYQFQWLTHFLQQPRSRPLVLVMVGDHQPPALVAGPGASWDVPVHIFSSDSTLLQRLQAQGHASGLQPPAATLGPMHLLTRQLLQAFSTTDRAAEHADDRAAEPSQPGGGGSDTAVTPRAPLAPGRPGPLP